MKQTNEIGIIRCKLFFFRQAHTVHYPILEDQESCRYMFQDGHAQDVSFSFLFFGKDLVRVGRGGS